MTVPLTYSPVDDNMRAEYAELRTFYMLIYGRLTDPKLRDSYSRKEFDKDTENLRDITARLREIESAVAVHYYPTGDYKPRLDFRTVNRMREALGLPGLVERKIAETMVDGVLHSVTVSTYADGEDVTEFAHELDIKIPTKL